MSKVHYKFGGDLSPSEMLHVLDTFAPKRNRHARVHPLKLFAAIHTAAPNIVEHTVNRKRGLAFDSGEAGFSHTRLD